MYRDRESRGRPFPVAKVFSEVSSLLGPPLDIKRRLGLGIPGCSLHFS
jgi:hypothetical protein